MDFPVCEIPDLSPLPRVIGKIDQLARTMTIECYGKQDDLTTFFGGKKDEPIVLEEEDILKLPHDLVHLCLSSVPESQLDVNSGLTPDIVWKENDKIKAVEIVTSQNPSEIHVDEALSKKVGSYCHLIPNIISEFNVVCVTTRNAHTLTGLCNPWVSAKLVSAFRNGLSLIKQWEDLLGVSEENLGEYSKDLRHSMSKLPTSRLPNKAWIGDLGKVIMTKGSLDKDYRTFGHYLKDVSGKKIAKTILHVPMILPDSRKLSEPIFALTENVEDSAYIKIFNQSMLNVSTEKKLTAWELESESEVNGGKLKKTKFETKIDIINVSLTETEKVQIGLRGVMAKKIMNSADIVEKRKQSQEPLDSYQDLSVIDHYVNKEWVYKDGVQGFNLDVLDFSDTTNTNHHTKTVSSLVNTYKELLQSEELQMIRFWEIVNREISINATRNLRDSRRVSEFIVRPIAGFQAFVVIRTTNYTRSSNIFFSIFFRGDWMSGGMFEEVYNIKDGWSHTEFLSTDRNRLSHFQGITSTIMSFIGFSHDQFGGGLNTKLPIKMDFLKQIVRFQYLTLLSASSEISKTLQTFRFYYMEVYSGGAGSLRRSQKITNKLPDVIRNPLNLYFIKKLFDIHSTLDPLKFLYINEEEGQELNKDLKNYQKSMPYIETPFGFPIRRADDFVTAMYMCNLHNSDISESGHGSVRIIEKTSKRERQYQERLKEANFSELTDSLDANDHGPFQASRPAIAMGSKLLRQTLCEQNGLEEKDYDNYFSHKITIFLLKSRLEELATTKVSTVPFDEEFIVKTEKDVQKLGKRKKCIEQILHYIHSGTLKHPRTACNVGDVYAELSSNESKKLQVTLFRKSQIGGDREIFVLTFMGRLYIKCVNDIFRCIAEYIGEEKLTGERTKDAFVKDHFEKRTLKGYKKYTSTFKVSSDLTNWAQLFTLTGDFAQMTVEIVPKLFQNLALLGLELGKNKSLQLPTKLLTQWKRNLFIPEGNIKSVQKLEREFRGADVAFLMKEEGSPIMINESNMMQGIYHYLSSVYHSIHLMFLKAYTLKLLENHSEDVIFDFEVSSDDEGIMISVFHSSKEDLKKVCVLLEREWPRIKNTVDKLFGIETSFEKSTYSWSDLFEFNSKFYVGNTIASPLIKFVARSSDDYPNESLSKRVSSLMSSLQQLRINGASGYLCHWISISQCLAFTDNLGAHTMSWFSMDYYEDVLKEKLTFMGYYPIASPIVAGLVDSKYYNFLASRESKMALKMCLFFGSEGDPIKDFTGLKGLTYRLFKIDKYKRFLKDLSLNPDEREADIVTLRSYLYGCTNVPEIENQLEYRATDSSIARSLAFLTRSDPVRDSVHIFYSALYDWDGSGEKLSLRRVFEKIQAKNLEVNMSMVFPMYEYLEAVKRLESQDYHQDTTGILLRKTMQYVAPYYMSPDYQRYLKKLLASVWFHKRFTGSLREKHLLIKQIKKEIPFLSLDESLGDKNLEMMFQSKGCPFDDISSLIGFIECYSSRSRTLKVLASGNIKKGYISISSLIQDNLGTCLRVVPTGESIDYSTPAGLKVSRHEDILSMERFEDRCKAWQEILYSSNSDRISGLMIEDLSKDFMKLDEVCYKGLDAHNKKKGKIFKLYALINGKLNLEEYMKMNADSVVYLSDPKFNNGSPLGSYSLMTYSYGSFSICKFSGKDKLWTVVKEKLTDQNPKCIIGVPASLLTSKISPPEVVYSGIEFKESEYCIKFSTLDFRQDFWIRLEHGQSRHCHSNYINPDLPKIANLWLTRNPDGFTDELASRVNWKHDLGTIMKEAMVKYCGKFSKKRKMERIKERNVKEDDGNLDEFVLSFAADLEELEMEEGNITDYFEADLMEFGFEDLDFEMKGLASFAMESFISTLDINPCLNSLLVFCRTVERNNYSWSLYTKEAISLAEQVNGLKDKANNSRNVWKRF